MKSVVLGLSLSVLSTIAVFSAPAHADASVWDAAKVEYKSPLNIKVYHSPTCGCCGDWVDHLKKHGFKIEDVKTHDMSAVKQEHNLPPQMASCHTAFIDGYMIEGHVPADDIKRLLLQRPDVRGLSVPQMPVGTPGMERGERKDPFQVVSFDKDGKFRVFNDYETY